MARGKLCLEDIRYKPDEVRGRVAVFWWGQPCDVVNSGVVEGQDRSRGSDWFNRQESVVQIEELQG